MCWLHGRKVKLAKSRKNKRQAEERLVELRWQAANSPSGDSADMEPPLPPPGGGRTADWSSGDEPDPSIDPRLAACYANLEIPYGADLETTRRAWKRLLKKYHPDLHAQDPEKRRVANQLTAELTRAYQEIEKTFANKEG